MQYFKGILSLLLLALLLPTAGKAQFKTKLPKPGEAQLTNSQTLNITNIRESGHIQVTSPRYDNIGQVLTKLDFQYESYAPSQEPYMIFMNCGTQTPINTSELRDYVETGGVLYASDLTDKILNETFPGVFEFAGRNGQKGHLEANIEDGDLRDVIGQEMSVHFDLNEWAVLTQVNGGQVLLRDQSSGRPLMVEVPYGEGRIFYTCFHNHKQASAQEEALLKLLIAKQVNSLLQQDFVVTAEQMGLNLKEMKLMFNR